MKTEIARFKPTHSLGVLKRVFALFLAVSAAAEMNAQSTAFTYQGRLNDGVNLANGSYDFTFTLFDAASAGNQVGNVVTNAATAVSNGLFTATVDFGNQFPGADRWLEIGVATNGGGSFTTLTPRQLLTATPYAVRAANAASANTANSATTATTAAVANSVMASNISGTISSNNIAAGSITSIMLAAGAVSSNQLADAAVTANKMATLTTVSNFTSHSWGIQTTLNSPAPGTQNQFAFSVAALNDLLIFGALFGDVGGTNVGTVYLLNTNGALVSTLANPTPVANDQFGFSVAALGSDRVIVGAPSDNSSGSPCGSAYLFRTNDASPPLVTFTNPTPASSDFFGYAVATLGNDRVLISANQNLVSGSTAGSVYLFNTNGALLRTIDNPAPASAEHFGSAISPLGSDRFIIGAPEQVVGGIRPGAAFLYNTNGTLLTTIANPTPANLDFFGAAVAAVGTDKLLVGAPYDNTGATQAGAAYLFNTNGTLLVTITNPTPASFESFGNSVSAVGPNLLLISAYGDNTGATYAGAAYIFSTSGALIATLTNPAPAVGDEFGYALAALDANRVVVCAPYDDNPFTNSGSAYIFTNLFISVSASDTYSPGVIAETVRSVDASRITGLFSAETNTFAGVVNANAFRARGGPPGAYGVNHNGYSFNSPGDNDSGMFSSADGQLEFHNNNGERMRINSDGNVGIGTTTPGSMLEVAGTVSAISFSGSGTSLSGVAFLAGDNSMSGNNSFTGINSLNDVDIRLRNPGDANHGLGWYGTSGPFKPFNGVDVDGPVLYGFSGGALGTTSGGQAVALHWNTSGNVGIGTTAGGSRLTVSGTVTASSFSGGGASLTSLNASSISSGTLDDARLSANVSLLGASIESAEITDGTIVNADINATAAIADTKLATIATAGKVADTALSANVALRNAAQTFSGSNTFSGVATLTNLNNTLAGNGAGLTNLNASNLTTGTIDKFRLDASVSLLGQTIESSEITDGAIVNADINASAAIADTKLATISTAGKVANTATTATSANTANAIVARDASGNFSAGTVTATSFSGSGANLTSLNASQLTSGNVPDARLSANVSLLGPLIDGNEISSGAISNVHLSANAAIADTKLATISTAGKVANTATTATSANTANAIVARDASGNFSAGAVTATSFTGNGGGLTNLDAAELTGSVPVTSLTSVPAANLTGTIADARLSANVALLNGTNVFTGAFYGSPPYLKFAETNANGTGGSAVAGANNFREFNAELTDTHGLGSLSAGDIVLPAGTYQCRISAPGFRVQTHQIRLRTTSGVSLLFGTIGYTDESTNGSDGRSQIDGQFTIGVTTTLRVQHFCSIARATDGLGANQGFDWGDGSNQYIFAIAEFWKIK